MIVPLVSDGCTTHVDCCTIGDDSSTTCLWSLADMAGACRGDACGHNSTRRVRQPAREVTAGTAPVRSQGQRRLPQRGLPMGKAIAMMRAEGES
ncbi:hypothetical protein GW17_00027588 [Ensete ventricosum]|nr:hypothetical protein GW17_00027588 [Ensete ventricosum]